MITFLDSFNWGMGIHEMPSNTSVLLFVGRIQGEASGVHSGKSPGTVLSISAEAVLTSG